MNIVEGYRRSPRASKYLECCSHTVRPRECRPGLCGRYAEMILVEVFPCPNFSHDQRPRPVWSEPVSLILSQIRPMPAMAVPPA